MQRGKPAERRETRICRPGKISLGYALSRSHEPVGVWRLGQVREFVAAGGRPHAGRPRSLRQVVQARLLVKANLLPGGATKPFRGDGWIVGPLFAKGPESRGCPLFARLPHQTVPIRHVFAFGRGGARGLAGCKRLPIRRCSAKTQLKCRAAAVLPNFHAPQGHRRPSRSDLQKEKGGLTAVRAGFFRFLGALRPTGRLLHRNFPPVRPSVPTFYGVLASPGKAGLRPNCRRKPKRRGKVRCR